MKINSQYLNEGYFSVRKKTSRKLVLILIEDIKSPDACQYIRLINPYSAEILNHEFDIRFGPISHVKKLNPDILIFSRLPKYHVDEMYAAIDYMKSQNKKIIYEIDDDLMNIFPQHAEFNFYKKKSQISKYYMKIADLVTVSTSTLRQQAIEFNPNVLVIRNIRPVNAIKHIRNDDTLPMKLLYMGSSTHNFDLLLVLDAIKELNSNGMNVNLYLLGMELPLRNSSNIIPISIPASFEPYPSFKRMMRLFYDMDYGIAPLVDNQFNQSKSAIKYFDYLEAGIPTVASDVGEYSSIILDGKNGYIIKKLDWYEKLKNIYVNLRFEREQIINNAYALNDELLIKEDPIMSLSNAMSHLL